MTRQRMEYSQARNQMKPGDVIAFSGKGGISEVIKLFTRSSVSHVGVILQSKLLIKDKPQDGYFNQIIESTLLDGFSGVCISRMSERVATYSGEIWWLPLSDAVRDKLDLKKFYDFLLHQVRKPYDIPQAIGSVLDAFDKMGLTYNREDFSKFFCSELVVAGLEEGGAIDPINASEVTPIDLCMFQIYKPPYYQIKGEDKDIVAYNTISPKSWGK